MNSRPLDDGSWHVVRAECQSYSLAVSVDDGDGWRRNDSVPDFEREGVLAPMHVGRIESVYVGGVPEFTGVGLVSVRDDLRDGEFALSACWFKGHSAVPVSLLPLLHVHFT